MSHLSPSLAISCVGLLHFKLTSSIAFILFHVCKCHLCADGFYIHYVFPNNSNNKKQASNPRQVSQTTSKAVPYPFSLQPHLLQSSTSQLIAIPPFPILRPITWVSSWTSLLSSDSTHTNPVCKAFKVNPESLSFPTPTSHHHFASLSFCKCLLPGFLVCGLTFPFLSDYLTECQGCFCHSATQNIQELPISLTVKHKLPVMN